MEKKMKWIKVTDRLPNESKEISYLVFNGYEIDMGKYYGKVFQNRYHYFNDVTHWMPLPELPEKE